MFLLREDSGAVQAEEDTMGGENHRHTDDQCGEHECVVCLTSARTTTLLPCRHFCVCSDCLPKLDKCPVCRSRFTSFLQLAPDSAACVPLHRGHRNHSHSDLLDHSHSALQDHHPATAR
jgi:Zinc finger, C3HC4 type (RING finger)